MTKTTNSEIVKIFDCTKLKKDDIIEISAEKHKEHLLYSRVVLQENDLRNNYKIMNLHEPMINEVETEYLNSLIEEQPPVLNPKPFLRFYQEDGLRHLIKNPEFWLNNQFQTLNSFVNDSK